MNRHVVFALFAFLVLSHMGCTGREGEQFPEDPDVPVVYVASDERDPKYPLTDENGEILLTFPEIEPICGRYENGKPFEAHEDMPAVFTLYTMPTVTYCVFVYRQSGYITLSHEEGDVTFDRESDIFRWCVNRPGVKEWPARLTVHSLTDRSVFWVALDRRSPQ